MNNNNWLDYLTAIGSMTTPLVVLLLSAAGWRLRQRFERRADLEGKLREDRMAVYQAILEPFILLLMSDLAWKSDPKNKGDKNTTATQSMLSVEYRRFGFQLSLMGSDSVVKAYNELMQYFFSRAAQPTGQATEMDIKEMMSLLGTILLEIRRSMGNESTELDNWGMLEWFMMDARRFRAL